MPRSAATAGRTYGTRARKSRACVQVESQQNGDGQSSVAAIAAACDSEDEVTKLADRISTVRLEDRSTPEAPPEHTEEEAQPARRREATAAESKLPSGEEPPHPTSPRRQGLRVLTWADVCPPGDRIEKIAEASYAEVYRVSNERGTSIIKVIRLESPIKPQTKAQERSGLVDEEPHREDDLIGEIRISEWLADIPGFVVYKERYIVKGRATKGLLDTHQTFHRRMKRKEPDRLQFYPSPSRYLHETEFLVIELGDAGTSLEDFELSSTSQLWDIFMLVAIALARAEFQIGFEHRDLHEGNLCVRQVRPSSEEPVDVSKKGSLEEWERGSSSTPFGRSGLDITILDYGLSRADDPSALDGDGDSNSTETAAPPPPIAYDLEKDLSLFTSTHAPQCAIYRRMRSFLIKGDRVHLPPESHTTPYPFYEFVSSSSSPDASSISSGSFCSSSCSSAAEKERISWSDYNPYTNVLWLSYIYTYLTMHFGGERRGELARFKRETRELWLHLDPDADPHVLSFASATDVVRFAVESGWVTEGQLLAAGSVEGGVGYGYDDGEENGDVDGYSRGENSFEESVLSIVEAHIVERDEGKLRRSPRRRQQQH